MKSMGRKVRMVLEMFSIGGRSVQIDYSQYDTRDAFSVTLWKEDECIWTHEYDSIVDAVKKYEKLMKSIRSDQTIPEEQQ